MEDAYWVRVMPVTPLDTWREACFYQVRSLEIEDGIMSLFINDDFTGWVASYPVKNLLGAERVPEEIVPDHEKIKF